MTEGEGRPSGRAAATLQGLALLAAATYVTLLFFTALARRFYPYDLEWLEGWMLQHVERLRHGLALYPPPSLEFIPANYSPLYYQVCAAAAKLATLTGLGGDGLPLMRGVSLLSALGAIVLIAIIVLRESRNGVAALIAAGLFSAMYARSDFWLDLARADSLYLLLLLAAIAALDGGRAGLVGSVTAGVAMGLAALTRQSAVVALAPMLLLLLVRQDRWAVAWTLPALVIGAGGLLFWERATNGWFGYYAFQVALGHHPDFTSIPRILIRDLFPFTPLMIVMIWEAARAERSAALFRWAVFAGLISSSFYLRFYPGGWVNVLIPAHAALALGGGFAWAAAEATGPGVPHPGARAALVAVLLQFALLVYDPSEAVPTVAARAVGDSLVARLRHEPAPVLVPSHIGIAEAAGHRGQFIEMGFLDITGAPSPVARALAESLATAVRERRWSVVVMDRMDAGEPLAMAMAKGYAPAETLSGHPGVRLTRSGARTRPEILWRPITSAPGAPALPPAPR